MNENYENYEDLKVSTRKEQEANSGNYKRLDYERRNVYCCEESLNDSNPAAFMANDEIKAGDIIYLKSGGPAVTVSSVVNDKLSCIYWWNGSFIRQFFKAHEVSKKNSFSKRKIGESNVGWRPAYDE